MLIVDSVFIVLGLLLCCCFGEETGANRWGLAPYSNPITADIYITCDLHTETYKFEFDSSPFYIYDACMNNFCSELSSERCEELIDDIFSLWHGTHYFPGFHTNADSIMLENRMSILSMVTDSFNPQSYLEIGTADDAVFNRAKKIFPIAIGVDPSEGGTHRMTSDEFFRTNNQYFDLVFVDGLHEANQVFTDALNSLTWLSSGGTIVLHDCNPHGILHLRASYPQHPDALDWNGDSWKAIVALRYLEVLDVVVVDIDHGVGVLRRRAGMSGKNPDINDIEVARNIIASLSNDQLKEMRNTLLPLVTVSQFKEWLRS